MKLMLVMAITVIMVVLLLIPMTKKYRGVILTGYFICALALSMLQTIRTAPLMLPYYHAKQQSFFQEEFADEAMYPDAFLQLLVKDKTVYIKDDLDDYKEKNKASIEADSSYMDDGKYWTYQFYHQVNLQEFLKAAGAEVIADDSFNDCLIDESLESDFILAGYTNDMNRYLFPLSELKEEWSNSFFYYWYYATYVIGAGEMELRINTDGLSDASEIVILSDDKENEFWYVMTKDYYDREVAAK